MRLLKFLFAGKVNQLYGTGTPLTSLLYTHHHYYSTTTGDTQCNSCHIHLHAPRLLHNPAAWRQMRSIAHRIRIPLIPSLVLWIQYRVYDAAVGLCSGREMCKRMQYAPLSADIWSVRSTQRCASNKKFRVTLWPVSLSGILLRYTYIYEIHAHGNWSVSIRMTDNVKLFPSLRCSFQVFE